MQNLLAVGLGGFLGAIARYTIGQFVQSRLASRFPWGTLAVNVIGCLLIGILLGWISGRENVSKSTELFLVTGILGSGRSSRRSRECRTECRRRTRRSGYRTGHHTRARLNPQPKPHTAGFLW